MGARLAPVKPAVTARADIVGSLLRPQELLEARGSYAADGLSAVEFKRIEDGAVDWAIGLQERAGLSVVTDGEMRRESFQSQMVEAVEGFGEHDMDAWLWGECKVAVLGLVTTKTPRRETPQDLEASIYEASRFIPLERLALSPQCGFATSIIGNAISVEDEEYKLRTIVETAEQVWGRPL